MPVFCNEGIGASTRRRLHIIYFSFDHINTARPWALETLQYSKNNTSLDIDCTSYNILKIICLSPHLWSYKEYSISFGSNHYYLLRGNMIKWLPFPKKIPLNFALLYWPRVFADNILNKRIGYWLSQLLWFSGRSQYNWRNQPFNILYS